MKPSKSVQKPSMTSLIHNQSDSQPVISKDMFVELMSATSLVEFSFNNTMYKQTDEVGIGSVLGSALANVFVGYY